MTPLFCTRSSQGHQNDFHPSVSASHFPHVLLAATGWRYRHSPIASVMQGLFHACTRELIRPRSVIATSDFRLDRWSGTICQIDEHIVWYTIYAQICYRTCSTIRTIQHITKTMPLQPSCSPYHLYPRRPPTNVISLTKVRGTILACILPVYRHRRR